MTQSFSSDRSELALQKQYFRGTHRICDPRDTLERIRPKLSKFGITRVANITGLDWIGIPVVMVVRPNSRSVSVSQGKGITLDAARVSGVMEAIELYHAENIRSPLVLASWEELSGRALTVDPNRLPPSKLGAFNPGLRILWIEGFDLIARQPTWVPLEVVTTDATGPELPGNNAFCSTSNGLASGNNFFEAACHALCELVERDATTLWYLSDARLRNARRLDLATIDDASIVGLLRQLAASGMELLVWDVTSDVEVPVFLSLLCEPRDRPERARYSSTGMGCHPTREIALLRALTEAAQSRLTLISGTRDDIFRDQYQWNRYQPADLQRYRALRPDAGPWRRYADVSTFHAGSIGEDLDWLLSRLRCAGLHSAVAVDLSQDDQEISVVRMVVPGLEAPASADNYTPGRRASSLREQRQ